MKIWNGNSRYKVKLISEKKTNFLTGDSGEERGFKLGRDIGEGINMRK